jgi:hypothetical protein
MRTANCATCCSVCRWCEAIRRSDVRCVSARARNTLAQRQSDRVSSASGVRGVFTCAFVALTALRAHSVIMTELARDYINPDGFLAGAIKAVTRPVLKTVQQVRRVRAHACMHDRKWCRDAPRAYSARWLPTCSRASTTPTATSARRTRARSTARWVSACGRHRRRCALA